MDRYDIILDEAGAAANLVGSRRVPRSVRLHDMRYRALGLVASRGELRNPIFQRRIVCSSACMRVGETELEMVQRHDRQGERHVAQQLKIIAHMQLRKWSTGLAENLLFNFEEALRAHQEHLERLIPH